MDFDIPNFHPSFFKEPRIKKIMDDWLVKMDEQQNKEFVLWFSERWSRVLQ